MCEAVAEQGSLAFEARGGLEGSGREKVTPRRGQPCTAQVHCSLQERQEETRRDPGLGACLGVVEAEGSNVLGVPVSLPYTEGQGGRYKVHNSVLWWERRQPLGRGGGKRGTVCALPPCTRLLCARMCSDGGRPRMQEWPNAEQQGDCGLHDRYMKTWRATVLWKGDGGGEEVAGCAYRTQHSTVLG